MPACTLLQRSASTLALPFLRQVRFTPVMPCSLSDARSSGASSNTCWQEQRTRVVQLHCSVQCRLEASGAASPLELAVATAAATASRPCHHLQRLQPAVKAGAPMAYSTGSTAAYAQLRPVRMLHSAEPQHYLEALPDALHAAGGPARQARHLQQRVSWGLGLSMQAAASIWVPCTMLGPLLLRFTAARQRRTGMPLWQ